MAISTGTAMLLGGGLSAAGSLAGGLFGGGDRGAGAAAAANNAAITNANIQRDQSKINRMDLSPYTAAGRTALDQLGQLYGWGTLASGGGDDPWRWDTSNATEQQKSQLNALRNLSSVVATPNFNEWTPTLLNVPTSFEADPGYAWRISEGNKALDRSAASRGSLYSGGQLKALTDWNQNAASGEYGNWWNRYTQGTGFNNAATQASTTYNNSLRQQDYANKYGSMRDVLGDWQRLAGLGQSAASGTAGMNTGISNSIGTGYLNAGLTGANYLQRGQDQANSTLWGGINSGIENLVTAGALSGWFSPSTAANSNVPSSVPYDDSWATGNRYRNVLTGYR